MIHDQGAYTPQGINLPYNSVSSLTGPYVVPAYQMSLFVCQTNKPAVIPVRGAGYPQAAFVMERLMDRIARELQIDRVEVRNRNLIPKEEMPYNKQLKSRAGVIAVIDSGDYAACSRKAVDAIDYAGFASRQEQARAMGRYLGLGFAHAVKALAVVRLNPRSFASRRQAASSSIPARWRWDRVSRQRWRSCAPSNWACRSSRSTSPQAIQARSR